eukprot:403356170
MDSQEKKKSLLSSPQLLKDSEDEDFFQKQNYDSQQLAQNKNPAIDNMYPKPKPKVSDIKFKDILVDFEKGYKNGEIQDQNTNVNQSSMNVGNQPGLMRSSTLKTNNESPSKQEGGVGMKIANEVDWFGFQTQLRKIVYELVEPTVKRALLSENNIYVLQEENQSLKKKIDELEFVFQKSQKRAVTNDDVQRKIHEQDQSRRLAEVKIKGDVDGFKATMDSFKQRISVVEGEAVRYQNQTQIQQSEVSSVIENFQTIRQKVQSDMLELHEQFKSEISNLKDLVESYNQPIQKCEQYFESQKDLLKTNIADIEIMKRDISQHYVEIKRLDDEKMTPEPFLEHKKYMKNALSCNQMDIDYLKKELQATDNYLEKYLPFKILNYLHDALTFILDKKEIQKLFDHLAIVFQQLESTIANDNGRPTLVKRDFFIPSLDLNYIQMQRRMLKMQTDNSSELRNHGGQESSQRSNSLISGAARDEASESKRRFGNTRSTKKNMNKNTNNQNPDNLSVSTRKTQLTNRKKNQAPTYHNSVKLSMNSQRRQSKIVSQDLNTQMAPQINLAQIRSQQQKVEDYDFQSKSQTMNRKTLTNQSSGIKPSTVHYDESSITPSQRLKRQQQLEGAKDIAQEIISESEADSPSFGKRAANEIKTFHNQNQGGQIQMDQDDNNLQDGGWTVKNQKSDKKKLQQIKGVAQMKRISDDDLQRKLNQGFKKIHQDKQMILKKLMKNKKQSYEEIKVEGQRESQNNLQGSPQRENDSQLNKIFDPNQVGQQSFQGATFHRSPTRQSKLLRQSSIDIFKQKIQNQGTSGTQINQGSLQEDENELTKVNMFQDDNKESLRIKIRQAKSEVNQEDLNYTSHNDDQNSQEDDDEEEPEYDDEDDEENENGSNSGSDTFSGNRVVNKKIRKLMKLIQNTRKELADEFASQSNQNQQFTGQFSTIKDKIDLNESLWREDSKFIKNYINQLLDTEKSRLKKELTERYDDITTKLQEQVNEMVIRRKREMSDTQFDISKLKNQMTLNSTEVEVLSFKIQSAVDIQKQMLESLLIVNILISQDEQDRKTLSLIGMNTVGANIGHEHGSSKEKINQMIKLDKSCMNCSGQNNPIIKSAFKMACLAYQPKPIEFQGQKYEKEYLAQNNQLYIEKILQQYSQMYKQADNKADAQTNINEILPEITQIEKIKTSDNFKQNKLNKSTSEFSNLDNYLNQSVQVNTSANRAINSINITAKQFAQDQSDTGINHQNQRKLKNLSFFQQMNSVNMSLSETPLNEQQYVLKLLLQYFILQIFKVDEYEQKDRCAFARQKQI